MNSPVLAIHNYVRRPVAERYMLILSVALLGYALMGRGFAYLGIAPLYVGEMCLIYGMFLVLQTRGWVRTTEIPQLLLLVPLVMWGMMRLLPYVGEYGVDAIRDAVVWGYAAFAVIAACLIVANPHLLSYLCNWYVRFYKIFLIGVPIAMCAYRFYRWSIPEWPASGVPLVQVKEGDVLVHLSGILAFWMADVRKGVRWFWVLLLAINLALMGVIDRAGLVAFVVVLGICMAAKPYHKIAWRTGAMLLLGLVILWVVDVRFAIPGGKGREVSFDQFVINFKSMFADQGSDGLDSTKEWRLDWWKEIISYTFKGRYFWTGKGFGINLADDDGFQVMDDHSLRNPHNVHMTVLARMGVPGLAFWAALHVAWCSGIFISYLRSRARHQTEWSGLFLFLFCFYLAFLINGSFDVFIEGPMGGIWLWTLNGVGIGSLWVYRNCPQALETDESVSRAQLLPAAGWRRPGLPLGAGASGIVRA